MVAHTAETLYYLLSVLGTCESQSCQRSAAMISNNMNTDFDPCQNFYEFACGNFEKLHPRPPYKKFISYFSLRADEIQTKVLNFFRSADLTAYPNIQKLYSMYTQCLDEKPYGLEVIMHHLEMVGLPATPPFHTEAPASFDESTVLAKIHRYSPMTLFLFKVDVRLDPRNIRANRIYFGHTPPASKAPVSASDKTTSKYETTSEEKHKALVKLVSVTVNFMYENLGVQLTQKQKLINKIRVLKVADFLMELDKAVNIDRFSIFEDLRYMPFQKFQPWTNSMLKNGKIRIKWNRYFEILFEGITKPSQHLDYLNWTKIMMQSPKQIQHVFKALQNTSREIFVCATWFAVLQSIIHFTPEALQDARDEYQSTVSKIEIEPRASRKEEACSQYFVSIANNVAGYVLAAYEDGLKNREVVIWMVEIVRKGLNDIILETPWMDDETKAEAINKLNSITSFISLSNSQINIHAIEHSYKDMTMESSYYLTYLKLVQHSKANNLGVMLVQNRFDLRNTIGLDPTSVLASYYQHYVHLSISSGFIGFPFYDLGLDALNFATMGSQIGHELGHAFDTEGKRYSGDGKYSLWLSDSSNKEYEKQETCFQKSYGKLYFSNIKKFVNGYSTLSENIADSIGFAAALKGYRYSVEYYGAEPLLIHHENFTHEQLFTLGFANMWCVNSSPQFTRETMENDDHSPASARVNGVLRNSKDFAEIWKCPEGTPMNPKIKCEIFY